MTQPSDLFPYIPEQYRGYMDYFSEGNSNKEPVILQDGTSVLFPNGWTDEDADKWRKGMELQRPSHHSVSARCFFHWGNGFQGAMSSSYQSWMDTNGHRLGCPHFCEVPSADSISEYADLFCDCHNWTEPKVLANGKDIAFPAGWTHEQARNWRFMHGFAAPTSV
jgi:hypothetical protein